MNTKYHMQRADLLCNSLAPLQRGKTALIFFVFNMGAAGACTPKQALYEHAILARQPDKHGAVYTVLINKP
jgi:hypothetical protein